MPPIPPRRYDRTTIAALVLALIMAALAAYLIFGR
jgi:hypothetical protein